MGDEPRPEVPCRVVSDIDTAHTDAPGWNITTWADRDGHEWERSAAPGMLRRYADGAVITRTEEEVRADHGPLTPAAVDNVAALVADESRYRQQWHAAARDRLAQSQGNAPTEVDTLLQVAQERVAQVEAERDAAIHDLGTMTHNWQELASDWEDEKVAREAAEAKLAELRAELDRMQAAHYRTGRHNHQLVYEQTGDTPSDDDPLVVVTFSPVMGHHVAEALNAYARTAVEVPDA